MEAFMTCLQCGAKVRSRRENVRYDMCGLPGVTLQGVEVRRCAACGEFEIAIPRIEDLHRALARSVIEKRARLTGQEIRFLRKVLGWSGADFAAHMGTTPETVSRWEQEAVRMGVIADRLLRLMVATRSPVQDYTLETLKGVAVEDPKPRRLRAALGRRGWTADAA
jgi:putative zinc finger/helix-turn-helix YgiT family protein